LRNDSLSYGRHFLLLLFFSELLELIDPNFAFGKDHGDYQLPSHGSDKVWQRADGVPFSAPSFDTPA
jgi:hypothetical protein